MFRRYSPVFPRCRRSFLIGACVLLGTPFSLIQAGEMERNRFLNEAPKNWKTYLMQLNELRAIKRMDIRNQETGTVINGPQTGKIQMSGVNYLAWNPFPPLSTKREVVTGRNSKYSFSLVRDVGSTTWTINSLNLGVNSNAVIAGLDEAREGPRNVAYGVSDLDAMTFSQILADPGFRMDDVRMVDVEGRQLAELHYEFKTDNPVSRNPVSPNPISRKGWVRLDPSRYWLLHSAEYEWIRFPSDEIGTARIRPVEYAEIRPGLPYVRKKVVEFNVRELGPKAAKRGITKIDDPHVERVFEMTLEAAIDQPKRDFTLSAFGLPEPVQPGIRWGWVLALIVGAVMIAIPTMRYRQTQK